MIRFEFPEDQLYSWLGATVLALAILAGALWLLEGRRRARLERFAKGRVARRLVIGHDPSARRPLFWLPLLGCAALAAALAQPRWGQAWEEVRTTNRDVLVCLDTSESMRATDILPSRLERATQKIAMLLDRASANRFGLVAFSGAAALQCPLTTDHGYFVSVLQSMDTNVISLEGTDLAGAIREAVRTFREEEESSGLDADNSRAILVISDGEAVSGDAVAAAREASRLARVYVIGAGNPRGAEIAPPAPMPRTTGSADSRPHFSQLDEAGLRDVAAAGNGHYVRARADTRDIDQLHTWLTSLSSRTVDSDIRLRLQNRYQWPLALGMLCFAGEGWWLALLPRIRRWRVRRTASEARGSDA